MDTIITRGGQKVLVGTVNEEKTLVGAFSVIVKTLPKVRREL